MANVEEAVVEVMFKRFVLMPPANVEVAVVVPMKYPATAALPRVEVPSTERAKVGVDVPIPTLPLWSIMNGVVVPEEVDEEMANMGAVAEYVGTPIESFAQGVEEPMPTLATSLFA